MAEKITMNDVNEPIESKDSAPQEEKRRFAKLRHFNEKRAQNTAQFVAHDTVPCFYCQHG